MNRAQRVIAFFAQHPNVWIDATRFESIGGRMAWRTAISEARQIVKKDGGDIDNRFRTIKRDGYEFILSEYMFVPAPVAAPEPDAPHDLNQFELRG